MTGYDKDYVICLTLIYLREDPLFLPLEAKLAAHGIWVGFARCLRRH